MLGMISSQQIIRLTYLVLINVNAREKSAVTHITLDSQPHFAIDIYIMVDGGSIVKMASSSGTLCKPDRKNGGKSTSV
jgi:hypothetical protein